MQWYPASTSTSQVTGGKPSGEVDPLPHRQIERVFNAADERILDELHGYADHRDGQRSPYAWRKYLQSQELYVRYCGWEMIRTMLRLEGSDRTAVRPNEAKS